MSKQKNIAKRILSRGLVLAFLLLLVCGFGNIIAYFETSVSAINEITYHAKEELLHQPTLSWKNKIDVLDTKPYDFQIEAIEEAYKGAWYRLNKSLKLQSDYGLQDYFSDSLAVSIIENFNDDSYVNQVDLNHELSVHLFSLDGIVIAFKDQNIIQLKEIIKTETTDDKTEETLVYEQIDTIAYDVVMKITDGRWKIIEMVRKANLAQISNDESTTNAKINLSEFQKIKGINYYPAKSAWFEFWTEFPVDSIKTDFALINKMGYNTVRIFIPFFRNEQQKESGYSTKKMEQLLAMAKTQNLKIIPTLFDFPHSFDLDYYPTAMQYLKTIIDPFKSNANIYAWDLKNEADLDFEYHNPRQVQKFLSFAIDYMHQIGTQQPITLGWMKAENANILADKVDFVTFHFYEKADELNATITELKSKTNKPIMLGEFGHSSYALWGTNEAKQEKYNAAISEICAKNKMPHLVWTLHDFKEIPDGVFGWKPWIKWKQSKFGIVE